jgi:hypothetical protein
MQRWEGRRVADSNIRDGNMPSLPGTLRCLRYLLFKCFTGVNRENRENVLNWQLTLISADE